MYEVYVCSNGQRFKVDHKPISLMIEAYGVIENDHFNTGEELRTILGKPYLGDLHQKVADRLDSGIDYEIVSHAGEVIRKIHLTY